MMVGHNPGISEAADLIGAEPLEALLPTSAVVCFSFNVDRWTRLQENTGYLEFYEYPKKYKEEASG